MNYPNDIYTEPSDVDVHTLRNLGPLTGMAGIWEGKQSLDINPKAAGPLEQEFVERIELQPIDPQANLGVACRNAKNPARDVVISPGR